MHYPYTTSAHKLTVSGACRSNETLTCVDENGKVTTFIGVFQQTARKDVLSASLFIELAASS